MNYSDEFVSIDCKEGNKNNQKVRLLSGCIPLVQNFSES